MYDIEEGDVKYFFVKKSKLLVISLLKFYLETIF